MKYMFLTYLDEKAWLSLSAAEQKRLMDECAPHMDRLLAPKKFLAGAPLHPTSTATTVRNQGGKRVLTDSPFAETREQLAGHSLVDAKDRAHPPHSARSFLGASNIATIEDR